MVVFIVDPFLNLDPNLIKILLIDYFKKMIFPEKQTLHWSPTFTIQILHEIRP
jgi:hypothetical protein